MSTKTRQMRRLDEKFATSEDDPSSLLWVNGTTDKRFDIAGNKFYDISTKKHLEVDAFHPLFFTQDARYALKYVQSHISKDYDVDSSAS